jgi:hypothetical protein
MRLVPFAAGIAGGIVIAAAGYTGYWFVAAGEIEDRIEDWTQEQRERGLEIESAATEVAGFPLRFEVALSEPRIHDAQNGWSWAASEFRAQMRPWNYDEVVVIPDRQHAMRILDKGLWRDIEWRIDDGELVVRLDSTRGVSDFVLDLSGIEVNGLWSNGPARIETLHATGLAPDDDGSSGEALQAALSMRNVHLPDGLGEELGENLAFLDIDASLVGPIRTGDETAETIAAWRDAGGTLELSNFRVRWGPLGIETNGTIALDGDMRPIGALTADIIGYGNVIDALIMSNMIPLGDAFLAKVAFNMLAEKPEDGGPPVLRAVPVTAQDGTIFVGPVKVAELPPLNLQ